MQGKICKICKESRFRMGEESFIGYPDRMAMVIVIDACQRPALSEEPMQTFVILQAGTERTVFAVRKMGAPKQGQLIFYSLVSTLERGDGHWRFSIPARKQ